MCLCVWGGSIVAIMFSKEKSMYKKYFFLFLHILIDTHVHIASKLVFTMGLFPQISDRQLFLYPSAISSFSFFLYHPSPFLLFSLSLISPSRQSRNISENSSP